MTGKALGQDVRKATILLLFYLAPAPAKQIESILASRLPHEPTSTLVGTVASWGRATETITYDATGEVWHKPLIGNPTGAEDTHEG